jgi:TRAP-type C4-dicarboxylate transport system permease small subunit
MSGGLQPGKIPSWLVWVGGVPLLAAMLVEFITVIGRHTGIMVLGSIELVQSGVLLSSTTAIVIATLSRSHAKVHLLLNRSKGKPQRVLKFINALASATFFLALTVGSAWIAIDMWAAYERSELLGLPYLPLRCFIIAGTFVTFVLYARRLGAEPGK